MNSKTQNPKPAEGKPLPKKSLAEYYKSQVGDEHCWEGTTHIKGIHHLLRASIRSLPKVHSSNLSHDAILMRELGEGYCRRCHKKLGVGIARYNDYLVLENKNCIAPICGDCAIKNPDEFYLTFRKGVARLQDLTTDIRNIKENKPLRKQIENKLAKLQKSVNKLKRKVDKQVLSEKRRTND